MKQEVKGRQLLAQLRVPADKVPLAAVLAFIRELAASVGFDPQAAGKIELITEEACVNVIQHAYEPGAAEFYELRVVREDGRLILIIEDQGLPFDFSKIEGGEKQGIGMRLIRAITDEVEFSFLGKKGKQIKLSVKMPGSSIDQSMTEQEKSVILGENHEKSSDAPLFREVRADDAVSIARCVYRVYGYTYLNEDFYYPGRIAEQLKSGKMMAYGAFNAEEEMVGYWGVTVKSPGDMVVESANAVVDPRYRGHDIFATIATMVVALLRDKGFYGINSKAVTTHPASQKTLLKIGAKETGVIIANSPPSSVFKNLNERTDESRRAVVQYYTRVCPEPERPAYLPPKHAAIIQKIYVHNGLNRVYPAVPESGSLGQLPDIARLDVKIVSDWMRADLKVVELGKDLIGQLKFRVRELCQQKIEAITLDFPISHPATPHFAEQAEGTGFFFCGIAPETHHGDALRYLYLNNVKYNAEQSVIVSNFAKELHDYVVKQYEALP